MLDLASGPDLLRLLVIPFFAYLAWRDIKTRRIPNQTWYPLAALAVILLVWDTYVVMTGDLDAALRQEYYIRVAISIGFIIPLSYLFWRLGGFGGADAKAFMIIAILFPVFPEYHLWEYGYDGVLNWLPGVEHSAVLPAVQPSLGVFSVTILSNTVLAGLLYPVALAFKNAATGYVSPGMFVAKPVASEDVIEEYGTILEFPDRKLSASLSPSGLRSYFSWRRLDLDALRMYLQWRGVSLEELRENPEYYRNPESLPDEPNPPGDGAIVTDGGTDENNEASTDENNEASTDDSEEESVQSYEDPWGAEAFLEDIPGTAYGTTPETLQDGLDTLCEEDVVWISPGIPFIVPMFVGLVVAFTYGDVLFAILETFGLAQ